MSRRRHAGARLGTAAAVLTAAVALSPLGPVATATARPGLAAPDDTGAAARAVTWLRSAQATDGSFDAPFTFGDITFPASDFATSEAVLAVAEHAQVSAGSPTTWDPVAALAAVRAFTSPAGRSPLAFLDADAGGTPGAPPVSLSAGKAAKFVYLVAAPLGLDARRFDPADDGAPVDLVARIDAGLRADGSYAAGALNATNLAVLANVVLGRPVDPRTVTYLRTAQQSNGGWVFSGLASGAGVEPDTTARTVQALVAAGVPPTDPTVRRAMAFLATTQGADGGFGATDGSVDRVASTALVAVAIEAAGWDPSSSCWRDVLAPSLRTLPYVSPTAFVRSQQQPGGDVASAFAPAYTTAQAVQGLLRGWQPTGAAAPQCPTTGYRVVTADGGVFALGTAPFAGSSSGRSTAAMVDAAPTASGNGTWLAAADGGVFAHGDARFHGSAAALPLRSPIVGIAPTPTGRGYWLAAADGGVFAYGDARFHGSAAALPLRSPIVGIAPTPTGRGYWLAAADGGVFAYGDARFHGSAAALPLRSPIVGIASTPTGRGTWLVAADGGVFAFGDAAFLGSAAGVSRAAVVALQPTPDGVGYHLLAADGGVFAFGAAPFLGSGVPFMGRSPAVAFG